MLICTYVCVWPACTMHNTCISLVPRPASWSSLGIGLSYNIFPNVYTHIYTTLYWLQDEEYAHHFQGILLSIITVISKLWYKACLSSLMLQLGYFTQVLTSSSITVEEMGRSGMQLCESSSVQQGVSPELHTETPGRGLHGHTTLRTSYYTHGMFIRGCRAWQTCYSPS